MTLFNSWTRKVGSVAIFDALTLMSGREVTLFDETIFELVDAGFEDTVFLFQNGRYECQVDDWLDQDSKDGKRYIRLSMMDRV